MQRRMQSLFTMKTEYWVAGGSVVFLLLVAVVLVYYRRPSHEIVTAPDGKTAWLVTCSTPSDCFREAAEACPRGYAVLDKKEETGTSTTYINTGNKSGGVGVPVTSDTYSGAVLIRCRP